MKNIFFFSLILALPIAAIYTIEINYWISVAIIILTFGIYILEFDTLEQKFFDKILLFIQFFWIVFGALFTILVYTMQSMTGWAG